MQADYIGLKKLYDEYRIRTMTKRIFNGIRDASGFGLHNLPPLVPP